MQLDRVDYYAVGASLPWLPVTPIGPFRRLHDPTVDLVEPHLTLVFPVPSTIGDAAFREHVRGVASRMPPFEIRLKGLEKTWDHWLCLSVAEGRDRVVALHDDLYTGILGPHLLTEPPFSPHVGLGLFVAERDSRDLLELRARVFDRARFEEALQE